MVRFLIYTDSYLQSNVRPCFRTLLRKLFAIIHEISVPWNLMAHQDMHVYLWVDYGEPLHQLLFAHRDFTKHWDDILSDSCTKICEICPTTVENNTSEICGHSVHNWYKISWRAELWFNEYFTRAVLRIMHFKKKAQGVVPVWKLRRGSTFGSVPEPERSIFMWLQRTIGFKVCNSIVVTVLLFCMCLLTLLILWGFSKNVVFTWMS